MLADLKCGGGRRLFGPQKLRSKWDHWNTISKHHFIHLQKVFNMAATNFYTFCVSPDYGMPNSWKNSRHIADDYSCYLYSCHKILRLHGSRVHQGFHVPPEMEIQLCQVRWARGPSYWASTSNPCVTKCVIQVATYYMVEVCWSAIMLEPHRTSDVLESVLICLPTVSPSRFGGPSAQTVSEQFQFALTALLLS